MRALRAFQWQICQLEGFLCVARIYNTFITANSCGRYGNITAGFNQPTKEQEQATHAIFKMLETVLGTVALFFR